MQLPSMLQSKSAMATWALGSLAKLFKLTHYRKLTFSIPVAIGKNISVIAVRAENMLGLRSRTDRVITRD